MELFAAVVADVRSKMKDEENRLYGYEPGNLVAERAESLFDTPHGHWNDPTDISPPHSSHFPKTMRTMIAKATHWVDILTMDEPTGTFLDDIVAGIGDAYSGGRQPVVRFLIGSSVPNGNLVTHVMLGKIAEKLKNRGGKLPEMYLAQFRYMELKSWNHAKIVAVDGRDLMTGGHNLWSADYLYLRPIFDISMRFQGPIATGGHMFANGLWDFVSKNNDHGSRTYCNSLRPETGYAVGELVPRTRWTPQPGPPPLPGNLRALWVTNSGWGVFPNHIERSDSSGYYAFYKAMELGKHCRISQQDFGARFWENTPDFAINLLPGYPYPLINYDWRFFNLHLVDAIAKFLCRADTKTVDMVLTSPDGRRHYNNLIPFKAIFNVVGYRMHVLQNLSKDKVLELLKAKFRLAKISSGGKDTWSDGEPKRNHAKFWMIDEVFYVGSENFYPSTVPPGVYGSIQEFGIVAEDPGGATRSMILDNYFEPMMAKAKRGEVELKDLTW